MPVAKQVEFLLREKRSKKVKRNPVPDEFRCTAVDEFYPDEREVLVSLLPVTVSPVLSACAFIWA